MNPNILAAISAQDFETIRLEQTVLALMSHDLP